ncbi:alpha/beta fold hydrolase [Kitasatospora sp. NPDC085895]|uniref:alpha/beta fold hydrolase n=1 Tax=Kitasatospora sp. NPDC085895 TaxID=3155057 RepID=UPI003450049E
MRTEDLLPFWENDLPGLPVFCLPHAGAGAGAFRTLVRDLRPAVNLQPVQLPGRENLVALPLVDNARQLVDWLGPRLLPRLDRPFVLAGHSMGSLIAAELTAWLERNGGPAPELLVVSAYAGDFRHNRMAARDRTDQELAEVLTELGGTAPEVLQNEEMLSFILETIRNDLRLVRGYRPAYDTVNVPILALGGTDDPDADEEALTTWRGRTTAGSRVEMLPGGHFAVFENPGTVAALIAERPGTPEQTLLDVLRHHLGDDGITPDDDFYAAGGDSLIALAVVGDLKERGLDLPLRGLLTASTVAELVPLLTPAAAPGPTHRPFDGLGPADRALLPAGLQDAYPASTLQVGLIYLCELAGDPSLYNDLVGLRVNAPFDEEKFRAALGALTRRHPLLRSSFDLATYSTAVQLVHPEVTVPVEIETGDGEALVRAFRERHLATGIDCGTPPAFRIHIAREPEAFRLTLAIHHAVIDGWSMAQLMVELLTCYDAELAGRTPQLPAVPADGHRQFVALEAAAAQSAPFWQAEADVPPLLLPDRPDGAVPDPVATRHLPLDPADVARLEAAAEHAGVPLKSLLLSLHLRALALATGRDRDLVTGLVANGRPEVPGSAALIGLFLNTVPLRLQSVEGDWAELAGRTWEAEQRLLAHRRHPLSAIEQGLGRPAFDVSFNFTHFHPYRQVDDLRFKADEWWSYDKASFPLGVDAMIDAPDLGSGVLVAHDPALVPGALVDRYVDALGAALATVAAPDRPREAR